MIDKIQLTTISDLGDDAQKNRQINANFSLLEKKINELADILGRNDQNVI